MPNLVERPKLNTILVNRIKQYIIDHDLHSGDFLPTEGELCNEFGVSRISVREATRALGFLGIIEPLPGRGLMLGNVNTDRLAEYLSFHFLLTDYPTMEFVKSRIAVEIGGFPFTMKRMVDDPKIYDRLNRLTEQLRHTQNHDQWIKHDIEFHNQLMAASDLGPLTAFHDLLQTFFHRFHESIEQKIGSSGVEDHQRIIDALRDQRLADACNELRAHIESHLRHPDSQVPPTKNKAFMLGND